MAARFQVAISASRRGSIRIFGIPHPTAHSLYVGSYGRNTAIQGFSDLDMLMQLPYSVYQQYNAYSGNGQSALLQAVKRWVEKTYAKTSIKADGQVLLVPFDDGITFEVVPGFLNKDNSYTHPDANSSWKVTNPRPKLRPYARATPPATAILSLCVE